MIKNKQKLSIIFFILFFSTKLLGISIESSLTLLLEQSFDLLAEKAKSIDDFTLAVKNISKYVDCNEPNSQIAYSIILEESILLQQIILAIIASEFTEIFESKNLQLTILSKKERIKFIVGCIIPFLIQNKGDRFLILQKNQKILYTLNKFPLLKNRIKEQLKKITEIDANFHQLHQEILEDIAKENDKKLINKTTQFCEKSAQFLTKFSSLLIIFTHAFCSQYTKFISAVRRSNNASTLNNGPIFVPLPEPFLQRKYINPFCTNVITFILSKIYFIHQMRNIFSRFFGEGPKNCDFPTIEEESKNCDFPMLGKIVGETLYDKLFEYLLPENINFYLSLITHIQMATRCKNLKRIETFNEKVVANALYFECAFGLYLLIKSVFLYKKIYLLKSLLQKKIDLSLELLNLCENYSICAHEATTLSEKKNCNKIFTNFLYLNYQTATGWISTISENNAYIKNIKKPYLDTQKNEMHPFIFYIDQFLQSIKIATILSDLIEDSTKNPNQLKFCLPSITVDAEIPTFFQADDCFHPGIKNSVKNTIYFGKEESQGKVITAPPASGKSAMLKTLILSVLLGNRGIVPASFCSYSFFDTIYQNICSTESIKNNISRHMGELLFMSMINSIDPRLRYLICIDEIFSATIKDEGVHLIDYFLMKPLLEKKNYIIFITTHEEQFKKRLLQFNNFSGRKIFSYYYMQIIFDKTKNDFIRTFLCLLDEEDNNKENWWFTDESLRTLYGKYIAEKNKKILKK